MKNNVKIAIVGDFKARSETHKATNDALIHSANALNANLIVEWIPTDKINHSVTKTLALFEGIICAPGSPYQSMEGALRAITYARTQGVPFLGT